MEAWWEGVVTIHSREDRFYRPVAEAIGFPFPNWSTRAVLIRGRRDTNALLYR